MKKIILIFTMLIFTISNGQECGFGYENMVPSDSRISNPNLFEVNNNSYCLNIAFQIVRNNDESNGFDVNQIYNLLALLNQRFNPHNITFINVGVDFINNSSINNNVVNTITSPPLFSINNVPNAINLYIAAAIFKINGDPLNRFGGGSNNLGGYKAVVRNTAAFGASSPHEIGHCLGLIHIFGPEPSNCTELSNGSNCQICGDLVCDTVLSNDVTNIMTYSGYTDHFTLGQGLRMRNIIKYYVTNAKSHQCDIISGPVNICPNNNYTYTLTTFGTPTVVWTSSPNLPINSSNTGLTVSIQPSASSSGKTGTITATINGTIVKTFIVKIGLQITNNGYINGTYDWVSINYGPMGLIASGNGSIASYQWVLTTESGYPPSCAPGNVQAKFANGLQSYSSTSPNVIVNWGSCKGSYILSCYVTTICGESLLYGEYITDVGDPRNNPCFTDALRAVIAPNPISDGVIKVSVSKTLNMMPCNFKTYTQTSIDYKMDEINNHVLVHDYNGNQIYEQYYETDEITIADINLTRGNYIVTLISKEGFTDQQVIIVE